MRTTIPKLTEKEQAVKTLLAAGMSRRQVAYALNVTTQAVGKTVLRIQHKTGWTDQA